jgi:hypothetical protein
VDSQALMFAVLLVVVTLAGVAVYAYYRRQRRQLLRDRFGPEYDRTVGLTHSRAEADDILAERLNRVKRFKLRPLTPAQADDYAREWQRVQARFVDAPDAAVSDADQLVARVMAARGYPVEDFDRLAEDVSVDHPHVVENYRAARALMERRERGDAGTEELRHAVVNYRALFDDLLEVETRHHRRAS